MRMLRRGMVLLAGQSLLSGARGTADPLLETAHISRGIYCISGQGGNSKVLKTDEGLLVVDSTYRSAADAATSLAFVDELQVLRDEVAAAIQQGKTKEAAARAIEPAELPLFQDQNRGAENE